MFGLFNINNSVSIKKLFDAQTNLKSMKISTSTLSIKYKWWSIKHMAIILKIQLATLKQSEAKKTHRVRFKTPFNVNLC
jgi:hypothetical protein